MFFAVLCACVYMRHCLHNMVTFSSSPPFPLQLSSALLFDAVHAVVAAVQELNRSQNVGATQLSCKSSKIWEHGTSLMNYLRMVRLPPQDWREIDCSTALRLFFVWMCACFACLGFSFLIFLILLCFIVPLLHTCNY